MPQTHSVSVPSDFSAMRKGKATKKAQMEEASSVVHQEGQEIPMNVEDLEDTLKTVLDVEDPKTKA